MMPEFKLEINEQKYGDSDCHCSLCGEQVEPSLMSYHLEKCKPLLDWIEQVESRPILIEDEMEKEKQRRAMLA